MKSWRRKKKKVKEKGQPSRWFLENGSMLLEELIKDCNGISIPIRMFSSHQILNATDRFDPKYFLPVPICCFPRCKGVIKGRPCLIKNFSHDTEEGEGEVFNDIVLSARVSNHTSFLKLLGCSLEFFLPVMVLEFPENGFLNKRGSVGSEDGPLLPWDVRLKIAKDVAIAVTYLHTAFSRIIIHRNIRPEIVALDENWNAKLTDFSFSVTLPEDKTWIEEPVVGTYGYADPIYLRTSILTEYSDVFSFGIFMLVLLMGRPTYFEISSKVTLLDYVKDQHERGKSIEFGGELIDMRPGQMNKFLELALRCCGERSEDRPKMIQVAKELKRIGLIEHSLDRIELIEESLDDTSELLKYGMPENGSSMGKWTRKFGFKIEIMLILSFCIAVLVIALLFG